MYSIHIKPTTGLKTGLKRNSGGSVYIHFVKKRVKMIYNFKILYENESFDVKESINKTLKHFSSCNTNSLLGEKSKDIFLTL